MTIKAFTQQTGFKSISMPDPDKEVSGVYIGDLLSWVMGKAEPLNVWITIMSNINTIAVATLTDVSCILLAEGVMPGDDMLKASAERKVNIISTDLSSYEAAKVISDILS